MADGGSWIVSYSFWLGRGRLTEAGVLSVTGDSSEVALGGSGFRWFVSGSTLEKIEDNI